MASNTPADLVDGHKFQFAAAKLRNRPDILLALVFLVVLAFLVIAPLVQIIYTSLIYQSNDLRPEDIEVSGKAVQGWVECKAYSILPVGSETIINVQSSDFSLSVKVNGFSDIQMDDPVWVHLNESAVNFYNGQNEKRIP